jgi:hypothetical protein
VAHPPNEGGREPALEPLDRGLIGRHLYKLYDEVAQQHIPKRFLDLLRELKRKTKG